MTFYMIEIFTNKKYESKIRNLFSHKVVSKLCYIILQQPQDNQLTMTVEN